MTKLEREVEEIARGVGTLVAAALIAYQGNATEAMRYLSTLESAKSGRIAIEAVREAVDRIAEPRP